jgi:hypothetical protein
MIKTPLTELMGIRYPIVQTGMGYVAGARLAAATSKAGGLGIIAASTMSVQQMTEAIHEVKDRTGAPFGVNIRSDADDAGDRVDIMIKEGVRVASFALAPKRELIAKLKDAGVVTMPSVGARRHAEKVASWGVDALIIQGGEGGGHTGAVPTTLLLPDVVDAVDIPVVAAGGFFSGAGLVAALSYGAAGVDGHPFPAHHRLDGARGGAAGLPGQVGPRHGRHHPGRRGAAPGAVLRPRGVARIGGAPARPAASGPVRGPFQEALRAVLGRDDPRGTADEARP